MTDECVDDQVYAQRGITAPTLTCCSGSEVVFYQLDFRRSLSRYLGGGGEGGGGDGDEGLHEGAFTT